MFTERHEQELSEIKALTHDLNRRFQEIVEQLGRIQEAQDQLAAQHLGASKSGTKRTRQQGKRQKKAKRGRRPSSPAPAGADEE